MKKIVLGLLVSTSLVACKNVETKETVTTEQAPAAIEHIYKPTYTDNFKIGDQKNVLIVEELHQAIFAKDFKKIGEYLMRQNVSIHECFSMIDTDVSSTISV